MNKSLNMVKWLFSLFGDHHMQWVDEYQVFLFDMDGLLVNTEDVHYRSYKKMCVNHGETLPWTFQEYCLSAHYGSDILAESILTTCPSLRKFGWDDLYAEKKQILGELLQAGKIELMPGVEGLLELLKERDLPRAVVTHSADRHVTMIREQHPILQSIPLWITREDYTHPKPHPEGFQVAINRLAQPDDRVIGFEDSPRGVRSLMGTRAKPVLVTGIPYPEIPDFVSQGVEYCQSFVKL